MYPGSLDHDWKRNAIIDAVTYAISTQFGTDVIVSAINQGIPALTEDWRCAQITLQRVPPGKLFLGGSRETLTRLAHRFLPSEIRIDEEWIMDLLREMVNVCAGQLKTLLKDSPVHFRLTTPESVTVCDFQKAPAAWYSASTGEGELVFGISIQECSLP